MSNRLLSTWSWSWSWLRARSPTPVPAGAWCRAWPWVSLAAGGGLALWLSLPAVGVAPAMALQLLLVAPLTEELVFRTGLQQQLQRAGQRPVVAVLVPALAFALLHGLGRSAALGLAVLAPACVLGLLYQRSRSLPACVAAHAAMNLVWLLAAGPALAALGFSFRT